MLGIPFIIFLKFGLSDLNVTKNDFKNKYKRDYIRDSNLSYKVTASKEYDDNWSADKAFDGNFNTSWVSYGSKPVNLIIKPAKPVTLKTLFFFANGGAQSTDFLETWHNVKATLYNKGKVVSAQSFYFKDAFKDAYQRADLKPVLADKIILDFYNPVKTTKDGKIVDPKILYSQPPHPPDFCPGYAEIVMNWK